MIFPIYWMFATAVRPHAEIFEAVRRPAAVLAELEQLHRRDARYPLLTWVTNSLIIAVVAVVLTVFINLLCGYTFAKFRFPGRNILFFAILGALMVPIQVILVPVFLIVSWLGLLNTHLGRDPAARRRSIRHLHGAAVHGQHPGRAARGRAAGRRRRVADLLPIVLAAVQADHRRAGDLHLHVALERLRLAAGRADRPGRCSRCRSGSTCCAARSTRNGATSWRSHCCRCCRCWSIFLVFQR